MPVSCIDLQSNPDHCGVCEHACKSDWHCTAGECRAPACDGKFAFGPRVVEFQNESTPQLSSVAAADLNGDGLLDLAVTDYANGGVGVRLNEGSGRFGAPVFYPTGSSPANLSIADFNRDGNLDLLAGDTSPVGNTSLFLGNGHGAFASKRDLALGEPIYPVAVGDINGDGTPDLVTNIYTNPILRVFLGKGDGTFAPSGEYPLRQHIYAVTMADLNSDQRVDVVAINSDDRSWYNPWVTILLGNADGSLTISTDFELDIFAYLLAIGDVDNDGATDVVAAGEPSMETLFGDGRGSFRNSTINDAGGWLALGDLDDDGNLDAVMVNQDILPSITSVMEGSGYGWFWSGASVTSAIDGPPIIGDFDDDGIPDVAGVTSDSRAVAVMSGKGDGTFADTLSISDMYCPQTAALGDVNRDGKLDLLTVTSSPYVRTYFNPLQDSSEPTMSWHATDIPTQALAADVDGDGFTDFVTAGGDWISMRFGTGKMWSDPISIASTGTHLVTLKDVDNDGLLDILRLVPWSSGYALSIWRNQGGRAFSPPSTYASDASLNAFAVGDFNGDQLPDLVLALSSANVQIALGMTGSSFASPIEYQTSIPLQHIRVADLTGDGNLDVIGLHTDPPIVVVLPGLGLGNLETERKYPLDEPGDSLIIHDVDGDGNLDIVCVGASGAILMKSNGRGDFTKSSASPVLAHSGDSSVIGDLNGDGWPDLVVTNARSCTTDVMYGKCW